MGPFNPTWGPINREAECSVLLPNGLRLVCPAYPFPCDYVRLVDSNGFEMVMWEVNEWAESPAEVMGAIMGAVSRETDIPETFSAEPCDLNNGDTVIHNNTEKVVESVFEDHTKRYYECVVRFKDDPAEYLFGEGDRLPLVPKVDTQ